MSVLIKGVDMPKVCADCPCFYDNICCNALPYGEGTFCDYKGFDEYDGRLPNCPLMDMPEALDKIADFMGIDIGKPRKPKEERTCGNCKWSVGKGEPETYVVCKNKDRYIMPKAVDMFNNGCERWEKE